MILAAKPSNGSRFLRWGGNCAGTGVCRVRVSGLTAVAAQFVPGSKTTSRPPTKSSIVAGMYTGANSQNGNGMKFFVPPGGKSVLNFSLPAVGLACAGGGGSGDHIFILKTAIRSDGSFTAKASQTGLFASTGNSAKFTYSIAGRFQGRDSSGQAIAAGTYREDVVVGSTQKCTSNNQTWNVTRAVQPSPTKSIQPGTYSGPNSQNGNGMKFFVPAGSKSVLNFSIPAVGLACAGGGGSGDHILILKAAIRPDGSFTAKTSQDGLFASTGANARFTYSISGYFQGTTSAGTGAAAGTYREDVAIKDGAKGTCTSNDQTWDVTRTG